MTYRECVQHAAMQRPARAEGKYIEVDGSTYTRSATQWYVVVEYEDSICSPTPQLATPGVGEMVRWLLVVSSRPEVCRSPHRVSMVAEIHTRAAIRAVCSTGSPVREYVRYASAGYVLQEHRNVQSEISGY